MEEKPLLDEILRLIGSSGRISIASSGARLWTDLLGCRVEGETIEVSTSSSATNEVLLKEPRIAFACVTGDRDRRIFGHGIVRPADKPGAFRILPYRLILSGPADRAEAGQILEKRRNAWRIQPDYPSSKPVRGFKFWFRAVRGVSIPLSVLPILIGGCLALLNGRVDFGLLLLALAGGVAAHLATNLISDYFDFRKGVDTTNALSSHTGVLVDELVKPDHILMAAMTGFGITLFTGGILLARVGWPLLPFGAAGVLGGFLYTGGPRGWKYSGLGELSTGFLMGPLMLVGAYFVQTTRITAASVLVSLAVGLFVSAVSLANNIRDIFYDRQSQVATLPSRIGSRPALFLFNIMLLLPYLLVGLSCAIDFRLFPLLSVAVTLPSAVLILIRLRPRPGDGDLDRLSEIAAGQTLPLAVIRLHRAFCLILLAGCAAAAVLRHFPG